MRDPYYVLGVSEDSDDEEIKAAYRELAKRYHPDNYTDDNPLKELAEEKMQEINAAYEEIQKERAKKNKKRNDDSDNNSYSYGPGTYGEIRKKINSRRFADAERQLFEIPETDRTAEWHYLTSVVLMHRNRVNDAMRELEVACTMDPGNVEYQKAKEMFNQTARGYGSTYYGGAAGGSRPVRSSADDACNCCTNLICMDCLCECLGGDLIRCI